QTDSLHFVDGVGFADLDFPVPGWYLANVDATPLGEKPLHADHWFQVQAASTTAEPQPMSIAVKAPSALKVGEPAAFSLGLHDLQGASVPHTDVWLSIEEHGVPVAQAKLHAHDKDVVASFAPPREGDYAVHVMAYPQDGGALGTFAQTVKLKADGV